MGSVHLVPSHCRAPLREKSNSKSLVVKRASAELKSGGCGLFHKRDDKVQLAVEF